MYQTQNYGYQQPYSVGRPTYPGNAIAFSGMKGRPVSSLEEVRASIIDFDGSIFYFPDLANKRIYTKQINADGTAILNMYELKEIPVQQTKLTTDIDYVTRDEFNSAITQLREALTQSPPITPSAQKTPLELNF